MKKSEQYLESILKVSFSNGTENPSLYVPLEKVKTYGKIVELEIRILRLEAEIFANAVYPDTNNESADSELREEVTEFESEIENLMKL